MERHRKQQDRSKQLPTYGARRRTRPAPPPQYEGGGADDVARPVVLDRELVVFVRGELRGVVVLRGRTHVEVYILVAEHGAAVARRRVRVALSREARNEPVRVVERA